MVYVKQTWNNGASGGTPISAARLNYIENGIDTVADDVAGLRTDVDAKVGVATAAETVTVGPGGTYATISAALSYLSKKKTAYVNGGFQATISLRSGFVMAEQIMLDSVDLGWINVTSVDAEVTVTRSAIPSGQGAWYAYRNAVCPRISCFFRMDTTGTGTAHRMFDIQHNSRIDFGVGGGGGGAVNRGLQVIHGSIAVASGGVIIKDCLDIGVRVANAAMVSIPFSTITNNTSNGIAASSGAIVQATSSTVTGHVVNVSVTGGAIVSIPTSTLTGAGAGEAANVASALCDVSGSDLTGGGVLASLGANVDAKTCVLGAGDSLRVLQGGIIHGSGRTGSGALTQTANLWTRDGVIFDDAAPSGGDALQAVDGSAAAPSHSFAADSDTGMYRTAGGLLAFTHNGVARAFLDGAIGLDVTAPSIRMKNGTGVGNIIMAGRSTDGRAEFAFQTNTFSANNARLVGTTNALAIEAGGVNRMNADATGVGFNGSTAVAKQTLGAAATDLASVITLANNIRTALINNGLGQA